LLKVFLLILNKKLLKQLNILRNIFSKKTIAQSILLIVTILRIIFLQKKIILKIKILSLNLSIKNLIDNLIIN